MTKQQLGFTTILLAVFCLLASLVTWSMDPLLAFVGLVWFVFKLILLWRGAVTVLILFFCLTRRTQRLASLATFWQEYSSDEGAERLLPGVHNDIERSRRRRESRRYLMQHGFSRKEARRHARMCH